MSGGVVVVFTGLPGTGKSTMADRTGEALGAPVFCGDWLLGALKPAHHVLAQLDRPTFLDMYQSLLRSLVERQCLQGRSAVADCLLPDDVLDAWHALADKHGSGFYVIECVCTDRAIHRERVEGRVRAIPGWHEVGWDHVERMREETLPVRHPKLVLNALDTVEANLLHALNYLGRS